MLNRIGFKANSNLFHLKNREKASFKGSITVEAAFVMPIVVLSIFALIYLAFYLHDKSRVQGVVDLALHKAALTIKHEGEFSDGKVLYENINARGVFYQFLGDKGKDREKVESYLSEELHKGLFIGEVKNIKVKISTIKITIAVEMQTKVNLPGMNYLLYPLTNTEISGEYFIHNPAETIRLMEVILETGSKIKGVSQLKEKLEDYLNTDKE